MARLVIALVATLSLTSVALADKPDCPGHSCDHHGKPADKPGKPDKPDKPSKPSNSGSGKSDDDTDASEPEDGVEAQPPVDPIVSALPAPVLPGRDSAPLGDPDHTELGESLGATPTGGVVKVKVPGSDTWTTLDEDSPMPPRSLVDARGGSLEIGSQTADGVEQHAVIGGAVFQVDQPAEDKGATDLVLRGGMHCSSKPTAQAASGRKPKHAPPVRSLWGSGKGRFRTHGANAVATVRGTQWIVADYCDATTVKVIQGVVDVHDDVQDKTYTVTAGHRHVARK